MEFMLLRIKIEDLSIKVCFRFLTIYHQIVLHVFLKIYHQSVFQVIYKRPTNILQTSYKTHTIHIFLMIHWILMLVGSQKGSLSNGRGNSTCKTMLPDLYFQPYHNTVQGSVFIMNQFQLKDHTLHSFIINLQNIYFHIQELCFFCFQLNANFSRFGGRDSTYLQGRVHLVGLQS